MNPPVTLSRRGFLTSTLALGAWTLGGFPAVAHSGGRQAAGSFGIWLRFSPEGRLTILSNQLEMGQGTHNIVRQIAAEELSLSVDDIVVAQAPVKAEFLDPQFKNYGTYGSSGFTASLQTLGPVCAAARDMLERAAAQTWRVSAPECRVAAGRVVHAGSGRSLPFKALLPAAAGLAPPEKPVRKPRENWSVLGQSVARADLPGKTNGSAKYGIDADRPGLLHAAVLHAPSFGGQLLSCDETPALAVNGVRQVVKLADSIAIVAEGYWPALKGSRALTPEWLPGPNPTVSSEAFRDKLLAAAGAEGGTRYEPYRDDDQRMDEATTMLALLTADHLIDDTYDVPFVAHATLEPMNALAEVHADSAELWLSTQSPWDTQRGVAQALGLPRENVTVHPQLAGGGFGRRLEHKFAIEAALIAKAVGQPVKMIWSREVDLQAGGYRPAVAARVRLALGPDHYPIGVRVDFANPSLLEYSGLTNGPPPKFDWTVTMGWAFHAYRIKKMLLTWTRVDEGIPCGYFRSVGASQNVFFFECVIDRAARHGGIDPVEYRKNLFSDHPRFQRFVEALAERSGWSRPLPDGHFRGIAVSRGNDAISGHVVEISVAAPGKFRLHHITAAVDVAVIGNPDTVEAQLMGGTLFGLSAALASEITLKDGKVVQTNFDDYWVARLADIPPMDILVLGNGSADQPEGAGEEGVASIGPALANALFAATGQPVTRLPLSRAGWERVP